MTKLILIKHAKPLIDPSKTSRDWKLSDDGRDAARRLIEPLRRFEIAQVLSSEEPKAFETAQIIADGLDVECDAADDLHEHDRSNVPHMRTPDFISTMALFFKQPDQLVVGMETATQARQRIDRTINLARNADTNGDLAIVTHGTVISLFAAHYSPSIEPFQIWRRMGLPSYLVFERETLKLLDEVDRI